MKPIKIFFFPKTKTIMISIINIYLLKEVNYNTIID